MRLRRMGQRRSHEQRGGCLWEVQAFGRHEPLGGAPWLCEAWPPNAFACGSLLTPARRGGQVLTATAGLAAELGQEVLSHIFTILVPGPPLSPPSPLHLFCLLTLHHGQTQAQEGQHWANTEATPGDFRLWGPEEAQICSPQDMHVSGLDLS